VIDAMATPTADVDVERPVLVGQSSSRFFLVSAVLMLLIVFLGFAPTFYLRGAIPERAATPLPGYLYVHGAVMTAWYLLFIVQSRLVVSNRTGVHRRVGVIGAALAMGVVGLGVYVTVNMVSRLTALGMTPSQLEQMHIEFIVIGNVFQLVAFGGLVTAAIMLRARSQTHRRLMFWAFVLTLGQALTSNRLLGEFLQARLPPWLPSLFLVPVISLIALAAHDWSTSRRVHPATLFGAAIFFLVLIATAVVATSPAGGAFVLRLG
jgi:hypothetical protein